MKNFILSLFLGLSISSFCSAASNVKLYGYNIASNAQIVIEIRDNTSVTVWLYDQRISSIPIQTGFSGTAFRTDKIQLPKPDFMSETANFNPLNIIDFSNSDNILRNLKTDGILAITRSSHSQYGGPSLETVLVPLYKALQNQEGDSINFEIVPEISKELPFRRYQTIRTVEGFDLINVIDSNLNGQSKSLSFLKVSNTVIYEIPEAWEDLSKIDGPIHLRQTPDKMFLEYKGHELFEIGNRIDSVYDPMELKAEKLPHPPDSAVSVQNAKLASWNIVEPKYTPNDEDLFTRRPNYDIQEFLVQNGKMHRLFSPEAYKLVSSPTTAGESIATWQAHQKLQVSSLGVMTYQDAPQFAPLVLDTIASDNQPVDVTKIANRLRVHFEKGNSVDYDLKTGQRLFATPTKKMCFLLFL